MKHFIYHFTLRLRLQGCRDLSFYQEKGRFNRLHQRFDILVFSEHYSRVVVLMSFLDLGS